MATAWYQWYHRYRYHGTVPYIWYVRTYVLEYHGIHTNGTNTRVHTTYHGTKWYHMVQHTTVCHTLVQIYTLSQKQLEIQALRCNSSTVPWYSSTYKCTYVRTYSRVRTHHAMAIPVWHNESTRALTLLLPTHELLMY
jgi:hypothetical protein